MLRPSGGLWSHPFFLTYWSAQSLSLLGIQVGRIALPLLAILTLRASASDVGLLLFAGTLPALVFGPFAGLLVDRLPRRLVLVGAHAGRAALLATVTVCALLGVLSLRQLFATAVLVGGLDVCFQVAYRSYLPSLVDPAELPEGYAKLAVTDGLMRTTGPGIGGAVVQALGAAAAVGLQALTFAGAGLLLARIRRSEAVPADRHRERLWPALRAGWTFSWRQPLVRAFLLSETGFGYAFAVMFSVQLVFFTGSLDLSPFEIGLIFAIGSVGGLVGGLLARPIGAWLQTGRSIVTGSLLRAAGLALFPLAAIAGSFALPLLIAARLVNAFGWTLWEVHQETTQQLLTPAGLRGRVNSTGLFAMQVADALGMATGAALAGVVGVLPTLVAGAVAAVLSSAFLAVRALWTYRLS
ncbi:MFS transporter [Flindersiella endophytica]